MKRKVELFLVVGLAIVASLLIYIYYKELANFFLDANPAYRGIAIFLLCFIGTSSILFPIPYTAAILSLSARIPGINLLEIALWGGLGSGFGELAGWFLGFYLGKQVEDSSFGKRLEIISRLANSRKSKWIMPLLVFVFAYTPLPDDIIFIVLGAVNYNLLFALIPSVLGKASMLYTVGYFGSLIGQSTSSLPDWISMVITVSLFLVFLALVELVDWKSMLDRYSEYID